MFKQGDNKQILDLFDDVCGEDKKVLVLTIKEPDVHDVSSLLKNLFGFPNLTGHIFDGGSWREKQCVADALFLKFSHFGQVKVIGRMIKLSKKKKSKDRLKDCENGLSISSFDIVK